MLNLAAADAASPAVVKNRKCLVYLPARPKDGKSCSSAKQENVDVPKGVDSIGLNKWLLSSGEIVFIDKRLVQEDAGVF